VGLVAADLQQLVPSQMSSISVVEQCSAKGSVREGPNYAAFIGTMFVSFHGCNSADDRKETQPAIAVLRTGETKELESV
jgi:hypothetical protein